MDTAIWTLIFTHNFLNQLKIQRPFLAHGPYNRQWARCGPWGCTSPTPGLGEWSETKWTWEVNWKVMLSLSLKLITFEYFVVSSLRLAALRQKVWGKWGFTKISISSHEPSFIFHKVSHLCFDILVEKTNRRPNKTNLVPSTRYNHHLLKKTEVSVIEALSTFNLRFYMAKSL